MNCMDCMPNERVYVTEFASTFARVHESWVRELSLRLPVLRVLFFYSLAGALGFVDPILLPRSCAGSNQSSPAFL